jgi:hypothetical protein
VVLSDQRFVGFGEWSRDEDILLGGEWMRYGSGTYPVPLAIPMC